LELTEDARTRIEEALAVERAPDVGGQFAGIAVPIPRVFPQAAIGDQAHVTRAGSVERSERSRLHLADDPRRLVHEFSIELVGAHAGDEFVEDDPEGIDVGPGVDRRRALAVDELLRGHEVECADELPRPRNPRLGRQVILHAAGDAEVDHLRMAVVADQDVARLEIAMDNSPLVPVGHPLAGQLEEPESLVERQGVLTRMDGDRFGPAD
jgi:hypothetical protein